MGLLDFFLGGADRVDGARARALIEEGGVLIDVRTHVEFADGHIEGARNIPVSQLHERLQEVPDDTAVVVYCRSGSRSARAIHLLRRHGRDQVFDLGPMSAW